MQRFWRKVIIWTLALTLISFVAAPLQQPARADVFSDLIERVRTFINPRRPQTAPTGRAKGGAGRGRLCPATEFTVAALVPSFRLISPQQEGTVEVTPPELVAGTTVDAHPTFWFYVPYRVEDTSRTGRFMLLDEEKNPVIPEPFTVPLSARPGMMAFRLPIALQPNKRYNWFFSIICDPLKPSRDPGVRGWIERVAVIPELENELTQVEEGDRYRVYAKYDVWFEAVNELAKQYQKSPDNEVFQQDWRDVLDAVGLLELENVPLP